MAEQHFYIRQSGAAGADAKVQGPYEIERIRGWIAQGRVRAEMEFSEDGTTYWKGSQIPGLFPEPAKPTAPAPVAAAPAAAASAAVPPPLPPPLPPTPGQRDLATTKSRRRSGRDRGDPQEGAAGSRSDVSQPRASASAPLLVCRSVGGALLALAILFGQWVHVSLREGKAEGAAETRAVFGLFSMQVAFGAGRAFLSISSHSYSAPTGSDESDAESDEGAKARRTTQRLGWALCVLSAIGALAGILSIGEGRGGPKFAILGTIALVAALASSILGIVFMNSGIVSRTRESLTAFGDSATISTIPGFSYWAVALATLLLAGAFLMRRFGGPPARREPRRAARSK